MEQKLIEQIDKEFECLMAKREHMSDEELAEHLVLAFGDVDEKALEEDDWLVDLAYCRKNWMMIKAGKIPAAPPRHVDEIVDYLQALKENCPC